MPNRTVILAAAFLAATIAPAHFQGASAESYVQTKAHVPATAAARREIINTCRSPILGFATPRRGIANASNSLAKEGISTPSSENAGK